METLLYLITICLFIYNASSACTYYAQRSPIPPFDEVARIPLGVCTGNHYFHSKIDQESVMYLCSKDKSHIIRYKYLESSKCNGDYEKTTVTRNPNEFDCNGDETCPYMLLKINNADTINPNDWRRWFSTTWVVNHCLNDPNSEQGGVMYTCSDNTGYQINNYDNPQCFGIPTNTEMVAYNDGINEMYCNQPDPNTASISLPDVKDEDDEGIEEIVYGPDEKARVVQAIETAICLSGRKDGHHREIGDDMVSYCFNGYDSLGKPTYIGDYGEIKWTQNAGQYGESYGIFIFDQEWAMAYCFSDTPDLSVCSKNFYVEHGNTARYYLDMNLEVKQCECASHNYVKRFPEQNQDETKEDEANEDVDNGIVDDAGRSAQDPDESGSRYHYNVEIIIVLIIGAITWIL